MQVSENSPLRAECSLATRGDVQQCCCGNAKCMLLFYAVVVTVLKVWDFFLSCIPNPSFILCEHSSYEYLKLHCLGGGAGIVR